MHHVTHQVLALRNRHDLSSQQFSELECRSRYFFCFACGNCLSNGLRTMLRTPLHSHAHALGHAHVLHNPISGLAFCSGLKTRRRVSGNTFPLQCGDLPCIPLELLGRCITFFSKTYILCYSCGVPTTVNSRFHSHDVSSFPICTSCIAEARCVSHTPPNFCYVCMRTSHKMKSVCVFDDVDLSSPSPWSRAVLCTRHARQSWSQNTVILKSMLDAI